MESSLSAIIMTMITTVIHTVITIINYNHYNHYYYYHYYYCGCYVMMRFSYYYHVCIAVHFAGGQIPKPKAMTWLATERSQSRPSKTQETLALRRRHCRPCFLPFLRKALQGVLAAPAWSARCAEVFWGGKAVRRGHLSTSGSRGWPTSAWTGASTAHSWSRKCCVHFGTVVSRKPKCNCHAPPGPAPWGHD